MPFYVDVPNETLVGRGEQQARIVQIGGPKPSEFDKNKQSIRLVFEITQGKFKGEKLTKHFTLSLSSKAALGQLYRNLVGDLKPGAQVDLEDLLHREVGLYVNHKDGADGPYAVVQDVFKPEDTTLSVT